MDLRPHRRCEVPGAGRQGEGPSRCEQVDALGARARLRTGLEPQVPIALAGIHVAYRQAADRQPRPEIVVQLTPTAPRPRGPDPGRPETSVPVFRAGTTVIARRRRPGRLPRRQAVAVPRPGTRHRLAGASDLHKAGVERLAAIRRLAGRRGGAGRTTAPGPLKPPSTGSTSPPCTTSWTALMAAHRRLGAHVQHRLRRRLPDHRRRRGEAVADARRLRRPQPGSGAADRRDRRRRSSATSRR